MLAFLGNSAMASNQYPSQPIKVIVPYAAGGANDVQARLISKYAKTYFGQDFVIVNIAGAGGAIGAREVLNSKPDGYTTLFQHYALFANYLTGVADFNHEAFTPACMAVTTNLGFVAKADAQWKDLKEITEDAKKYPGKIKVCAEIGGTSHFQVIPLQIATNNAFVFVAAKGGDMNKITMVMGGHVDFAAVTIPSTASYIQSGELKALAVTSPERSPFLPDVPTAKELGIDMAFTQDTSFYMPPNTPKDIVMSFSKAIKALSEDKDYATEINKMFFSPRYMDSEEFMEHLNKEYRYWAKLAEMGGIKSIK
jgi:tripartite-type tricarboxylate transporter receptor subunit TctC